MPPVVFQIVPGLDIEHLESLIGNEESPANGFVDGPVCRAKALALRQASYQRLCNHHSVSGRRRCPLVAICLHCPENQVEYPADHPRDHRTVGPPEVAWPGVVVGDGAVWFENGEVGEFAGGHNLCPLEDGADPRLTSGHRIGVVVGSAGRVMTPAFSITLDCSKSAW